MNMRRLISLARGVARLDLCCAVLAAACDPAPPAAAPEAARVVAVAAAKPQTNESDLCDVLKAPSAAPTFAFPEALEGTPSVSASGWRWINVWATWCPPCVEELALITRFRGELASQGAPVGLQLLSVDQTSEAVQKFAEAHAEAKTSVRLSDPSKLEAWLTSVGLDAGATLPIHLFVDPAGKVRCARTGAVRDSDLPLIKKLVTSP